MSDKVPQFRSFDDENYVFKSPEKREGENISEKVVDGYKDEVDLLMRIDNLWERIAEFNKWAQQMLARLREIDNRLQELSEMRKNSYNPELFDEVRFQRMKENKPNITKEQFIHILSVNPAILEEEQSLLLEKVEMSKVLEPFFKEFGFV